MIREIEMALSGGRSSQWPVIDYKLKNVGDQLGIVTRVTLDVLESVRDLKPELYFQLLPTPTKGLVLRVINLGWAPAREVEMNFLQGTIRKYLTRDDDQYLWTGIIDDFISIPIDATELNVCKKIIIPRSELHGHVRFKDVLGNEYQEDIHYDSVPRYKGSGWQVVLTTDSLDIETTDPFSYFCLLIPSAVYDAKLEPKATPYSVDVPVSHALKAGEADRFQIAVASSCSADYSIKSRVEVEGSVIHETDTFELQIRFPRLLPHHGYRNGLSLDLDDPRADRLKMSLTREEHNKKMGKE